MSGLWRDNPATKAQLRLAVASAPAGIPPQNPPKKPPAHVTQADLLLAMLRERRNRGAALELPEILQTGIAQFTARIFELRERGFVIENEMERGNGQVKSRYWLRFDPERDGAR